MRSLSNAVWGVCGLQETYRLLHCKSVFRPQHSIARFGDTLPYFGFLNAPCKAYLQAADFNEMIHKGHDLEEMVWSCAATDDADIG